MPAKKKTAKKRAVKKAPARKPKKVYVCVPCGMEVTISKAGMGVTRLMCCGQLMEPKGAKKK